jgi:hypothetical protein
VRLADDLPGGGLRDDAELGLRLRERGLDIQPGLKARGFREQRADARILDAE